MCKQSISKTLQTISIESNRADIWTHATHHHHRHRHHYRNSCKQRFVFAKPLGKNGTFNIYLYIIMDTHIYQLTHLLSFRLFSTSKYHTHTHTPSKLN